MARLNCSMITGGAQLLHVGKRLAEVLVDLGSQDSNGDLLFITQDGELAADLGRLIFCKRHGLARIVGPFLLAEDWDKDAAQLLGAVREQDVTADDCRLVLPLVNWQEDWRAPGMYLLVWFRECCSVATARLRFQQMGLVPGGLRSLAAFIARWPKQSECHVLAIGEDPSVLGEDIVPEFCNCNSFPVYRRTLGVARLDVGPETWTSYLVRIRSAPEPKA